MSTKVKHLLSSDFVDTYKNIKKGEIVEYENKTYRVIWIVMELGEAIIFLQKIKKDGKPYSCLLYTSPSPRDRQKSRMPSSA